MILKCARKFTDMPFFRTREEVQYEKDLTKMFSRLLDPVIKSEVPKVSYIGMKKVLLRTPLDEL